MLKCFRKVDFSYPTDHYVWKFLLPLLEKILSASQGIGERIDHTRGYSTRCLRCSNHKLSCQILTYQNISVTTYQCLISTSKKKKRWRPPSTAKQSETSFWQPSAEATIPSTEKQNISSLETKHQTILPFWEEQTPFSSAAIRKETEHSSPIMCSHRTSTTPLTSTTLLPAREIPSDDLFLFISILPTISVRSSTSITTTLTRTWGPGDLETWDLPAAWRRGGTQ